MIKKCVAVFLLFSTLSVTSQDKFYTSLTIPDNLVEHANAVVRLNETKIIIESQQKMRIMTKRIITVLNKSGNKNINAFAGYDKYNKIKKIEAIIYDASGKEIKKIKKKDFIDHSAVDGGTLYSDSRVLFMSYVPIKYPYTVEFTCESETPNTAGIPSWNPIRSYFLGIEKDIYSISDQVNLGLNTKEINFKTLNVEKKEEDYTKTYSISNAQALKPEEISSGLSQNTPIVMFNVEKFHFYGVDGQAKNWLEFGDWINNKLLEGRREVSQATKNEILNLTNGIEDPIDKAKLVYKYVQDNTRYISVQVGIGGVQPILAIEVDKLKYGDCKGLTNYTQALLEVVGVTSYYSIVEAGRQIVDFYDDFHSLEQGNHIILCIPTSENNIWLDCTSQKHPFGFIGDFTDNRSVLVVKPNASEIVKTSRYINETNHKTTNSDIKLNSNGSIEANIDITSEGITYDRRFFLETESDRDVIEFYKQIWGYVNNLELKKYAFKNEKKTVQFYETLQVKAQNYATKIGTRLMFKPNCFSRNSLVPDRYRNRKSPMKIQRGYLVDDEFKIEIPEDYSIENIPEDKSITNKFGTYSISFKVNENRIIYKRKLLIKEGAYSKDDYNLYREFRRSISKIDNSKVILNKSE